jgi:hypothetical protein
MQRRSFLRGTAVWALASLFSSPLGAATGDFEEVLALLKEASPTGHRIVAGYLAMPNRFQIGTSTITVSKHDPASWLDVFPPERFVLACNTMVHETCHGFCRLKALSVGVQSPGLAVFPAIDETIMVPGTATFPSVEAGPAMLSVLQNTQRFQTYIAEARLEHSTQQHGIYGLLNEFTAYYVGNRTAYDMIVHLAKKSKLDGWAWLEHITGISGTLTAHQEFRGFILSYLLFARKNRPGIYSEIMANSNLSKAYVALEAAHSDLDRRWFEYLPKLVGHLEQSGVSLRLIKGHVFYKNSGRGLGFEEYRKIAQAIDTNAELRKMEETLG